MAQNTIVVDQLRGDILQQSMKLLQADPTKVPENVYDVKVEPGVAMLVEPVNDHAFVFMPPNVVHRFESAPGDGTDKLRQRMLASVFFGQVVEQSRLQARTEPLPGDVASRRARP